MPRGKDEGLSDDMRSDMYKALEIISGNLKEMCEKQ